MADTELFVLISQPLTKRPTESESKTVLSWSTSNVAVQSKDGNLVVLEVVLVGADTRDNNRSGQDLVLRPGLAFKVVDFEEDLVVAEVDSEVASAAIEVEVSVTEEEEEASVIEEALLAGAASDYKLVVGLEAEVGMQTVRHQSTHQVVQVAVVEGMAVNQTGQSQLNMAIEAAMGMVIATDIVEAARVEVQGMTAAIHVEA